MNSIASKIINDFTIDYLSKLIDRIIAKMDESPKGAVEKKLSADLAYTFPNPEIGFITELENITKMILNEKSAGKNIANIEQQLNEMVYRLYDLSFDEVKVVDPNFALSEDEYNAIKLEE